MKKEIKYFSVCALSREKKKNLKYRWWPQSLFLELVMQPQLALKTPHVAVEFLLLNIYSVLDSVLSTLYDHLTYSL